MTCVVVGLGNPGEEYADTRHNAGRMVLEQFAKQYDFSEWEYEKKSDALVSKGKIGGHSVVLLLPETFMNASGKSVGAYVKSAKAAQRLIVVYDELDIGFGSMKISFGRSSGGHRGVESIMKAVKSKDFVRLRIGISPRTAAGKVKKPKGEHKVLDFILKPFTPTEKKKLSGITKTASDAIAALIKEGRMNAMNQFN
ncbi:aminoacyl-tRNA hydrolase [Candidatus Kaiserbacteria bacterium CG10_big_fil_rev_8_21_14_0_10_49_17]|uniref:Peptidyl-tRNA hydrolase n=1 Tax=Candidatus Kaiserbacteria bacterium CG10_big_fil_rev_8_21_14_0_10_49_17 TaxID=1974609 RepID=A0A2M6WDK0_9BACT|nr:MAG: aminoacyl-tRNA hydrolase [Candidatus Kaiserbacteria bacterium CG10_big_fil_rev_8_21_14_0_10_49_17]